MSGSSYIIVDHLGVALAGRKIIDDLSLSLEAGQFVALIGPNGSGKTTFLRALAGQMAISGSITLNGTALASLSLPQRARAISYLPQDMRQPIWPVPVRDIVALGLMPFDARADGNDPAIEQQLQDLDLLELAERGVERISGGERMRALLARALVGPQPIVLLDEPLNSLDPAHQLRVMDLLQKRAQAGSLVIAVIHDVDFAVRYATRILAFKDGRLAADGPPRRLIKTDVLGEIFGVSMARAQTPDGPILAMRPHRDLDRA
ncbi:MULTISPECIES: ABC transporter ATP-binding protein [unclassified Beijerinckia]|uniref:ABC transporter ATP-binding protein n=1 Tax=unclassified Beijerinckia TaxID=2638183 RepID=UPI0008958F08|nr:MULTISPECIES: ABC transporter ATP-binding protein [unclassified Beijerinckia]MDH7797951.1 iron complex transport system ATP-binding protein [Beijerinckia sp. GAS462]SED03908.1 iron complex transport system ATP-binding protein [Beijerinckia sp. 28-YEA-48]